MCFIQLKMAHLIGFYIKCPEDDIADDVTC